MRRANWTPSASRARSSAVASMLRSIRGARFASRPANVSVPVELGRIMPTAITNPAPVGLCEGSRVCCATMWRSSSPGTACELAVHTIAPTAGANAPIRSACAA